LCVPLLDEAEMTQNNSRVLGHVHTFPLFSGDPRHYADGDFDGWTSDNEPFIFRSNPFSHYHVTLVNNNSHQLLS